MKKTNTKSNDKVETYLAKALRTAKRYRVSAGMYELTVGSMALNIVRVEHYPPQWVFKEDVIDGFKSESFTTLHHAVRAAKDYIKDKLNIAVEELEAPAPKVQPVQVEVEPEQAKETAPEPVKTDETSVTIIPPQAPNEDLKDLFSELSSRYTARAHLLNVCIEKNLSSAEIVQLILINLTTKQLHKLADRMSK